MTAQTALQYRLAQACRGREGHADCFSIEARRCGDGRTRVWWHDTQTGQAAPLGTLSLFEARTVLPALFRQLRAWRAAAEGETEAQAMAAGAAR